jgi:hypothetical protein
MSAREHFDPLADHDLRRSVGSAVPITRYGTAPEIGTGTEEDLGASPHFLSPQIGLHVSTWDRVVHSISRLMP